MSSFYKLSWSDNSKRDLREIYLFIKINSPKGAKNVIQDIVLAANSIKFPKQNQIEEYYPECRRVVVRNYKILYTFDEKIKCIYIVRVFDARQNPSKIKI